jgi:hypothetical protein
MRALALAAACALALAGAVRAEETPRAAPADVEEALQVLAQWTAAYQAEDYNAQWRLTDPRIRRWWHQKRWRKAMVKARRKDGKLTAYEVEVADAIDAEKLPCTEMRHCYRRGVQYVVVILRTTYEKAAPGQPEYAAMAKSDEGWRFGGGTFPNRPLGETAVILTESDERLYRPEMPMR